MKVEDEALARRLVTIKSDLRDLRLQRSSTAAKELIEDAIDAEAESGAVSLMSDTPTEQHIDPALRQCGVTINNIRARRFSVF